MSDSPLARTLRRPSRRPSRAWAALLLALAAASAGRAQPPALTPEDAVGLELSASSPEHVAGTFTRDGAVLRFDARIAGGRATLALADGAERPLYEGVFEARTYRQSFLGGRLQAEGTFDAAGEPEAGRTTGDETAVDALRGRAEYRLLPRLSRALGARGLTGRSHPASFGLHQLGLAAAKASPAEKALNQTPARPAAAPSAGGGGQPQCFNQQGDPCHDNCFGMCGKGCSCWSWVCGDCCVNYGCLVHDRVCSLCWCGKGSCRLCYFPPWVVNGCWYQSNACPNFAACPLPTVATAPPAQEKGPLAAVNANGGLRVFYLDAQGHVAQVAWQNGQWSYTDATHAAGALAAAEGSALTAMVVGGNPQVYFQVAGSNHLGQLYWTGSQWKYGDPTASAGASPLSPGSPLSSFVTSNQAHVYYLGSNGDVYELYYDGSKWIPTDLVEAASGAQAPAPGSRLTSLAVNGAANVFYQVAAGSSIALLAYNNGWKFSNPTASAKAPAPLPGSSLVSEVTGSGNLHAFYVGTDSHVYELYYTGSQWIFNDPVKTSGAPAANPGTALAAMPINNNTHIYYEGPDGWSVFQIYYTGSTYAAANLMAVSVAPTSRTASPLASLVVQSYAHVYYLSEAGQVYELYNNGSAWIYDAVTKP